MELEQVFMRSKDVARGESRGKPLALHALKNESAGGPTSEIMGSIPALLSARHRASLFPT